MRMQLLDKGNNHSEVTTMLYKEFNVKYDDAGNGSIEGYGSTWIREPDSYGDVVKVGAFTRTLADRWKGGKNIPLLWSHKMDDLNAYVGRLDAEEDEKGLHFKADFDATPEAQRVRELYKDGRLSKFSIGYVTVDEGGVTLENGMKANELRDVELYEISCVLAPANDDAGVLSVKAEAIEDKSEANMEAKSTEIEEKSGRRNRKSDADKLRQIRDLVDQLLEDEVDDTEDDPIEEDEVKANEASEEPEQSNSRKNALLEVIAKMRETEE